MYDDYYGLSGRPFQLTPDPRFWFDTVTHKKAMAYLGYGLSQGEGFIVVTGDPGTGKTTLLGHLVASIDRERLHVVNIASTQVEPDDLLRMVAEQMDVDAANLPKSDLLIAIERALHVMARSGKRTLLMVDEAQALPPASLEELRMLSNLQAGGHALLQIFLVGQGEFRERLQGSQRLEQLRQRVIAMHHLEPMGPEEVEPYLFHRLALVGWRGKPRFTEEAIGALYRGSQGVPRQLNQLAGRVLLHGAIERLDKIDGPTVEAVLSDALVDMPSRDMPSRDAAAPASTPFAVDPNPVPPVTQDTHAPIELRHSDPEPEDALPIRGETPLVWDVEPEPEATPEPEPIAEIEPEGEAELEAELVAQAEQETEAEAEPDIVAPEPAPVVADGMAERIAALEARVEEQEAALRRVLTLLVDWVEAGDSQRPDLSRLRA
jgi:type II secretory pathway predicted ATPase ExeA